MVPAGWRPAVTLGALGFFSGIMTTALGLAGGDSVLIGAPFAFTIGLGVFLSIRNPWTIPVLVLTTMLAWTAVVALAWLAIGQGTIGGGALFAGALGAVLTHLGCSIFAPHLRHPTLIALTGFVGMAAAMMFFQSPNLFAFWQGAVAFCIGAGLGSPGGEAVAAAGDAASGTGAPASAEAKSPAVAETVPPAVADTTTAAEGRPQEQAASLFPRLFGERGPH